MVYKVLWHLSYLPQWERGLSVVVRAPQAPEADNKHVSHYVTQ